MSRLSYGLERGEKIEAHAARVRTVEKVRRDIIRRELQANAPFRATPRYVAAVVACAAAAAALAAFLSI